MIAAVPPAMASMRKPSRAGRVKMTGMSAAKTQMS